MTSREREEIRKIVLKKKSIRKWSKIVVNKLVEETLNRKSRDSKIQNILINISGKDNNSV